MGHREDLSRALAVSPDNIPLLLLYAEACLGDFLSDDARRTFEHILALQPENSAAQLGVARVLFLTGLSSEAAVRLEKAFTFAQGQHVSLSADLFNAFNSRNYGCYNTTINPTSGPPNANYGVPTCAALGRRFQIGLRYGLASLGSSSTPGND
jgi:hypothetical protein